MFEYTELFPSDRGDLQKQAKILTSGRPFDYMAQLNLFCSGMGCGKSRIMSDMPRHLNPLGVTFVLSNNENLTNQLKKVFREAEKAQRLRVIVAADHNVESQVRAALIRGECPVILCHYLRKRGKMLNKHATQFVKLMKLFHEHRKLVLIDEMDTAVTSLTGGINAKLDHPISLIDGFRSVCEQDAHLSLNLFDAMREHNAKVWGFSGTSNNLISSKIPSMGYAKADCHIINVFPIEGLYTSIEISQRDTNDISSLDSFLKEIESIEDRKGLLIFSSTPAYTAFKRKYATYYGKSLSHVLISGENKTFRNTPEWKKELETAKYVCGLNMVGVGFDLATHCEGQEFGLVIIFRTMCDKVSQPLSKNKGHFLHHEISAAILQAIARMRKGGKAVLSGDIPISSFYEEMVKIFYTIRDGCGQCDWVGAPRISQVERYCQCLLLALIQNIRFGAESRPVVAEILDRLRANTTRDFKAEYESALDSGDTGALDANFWIAELEVLWRQFSAELGVVLPARKSSSTSDSHSESGAGSHHEGSSASSGWGATSTAAAAAADKSTSGGAGRGDGSHTSAGGCGASTSGDATEQTETTTGGGKSQKRLKDLRVEEIVKGRAEKCCHCGNVMGETEEKQVCHVRRNDSDGDYSVDNLMYGCRACDSSYDAGRIIHMRTGGHWLSPLCATYKPDLSQLKHINLANIQHRFDWEMKRKGFEGRSSEFLAYLTSQGYLFVE